MRKLVGLASLAVLIAMAAPANADPNDDTRGSTDGLFLASVEEDGITFKDGPAAITAGKQSCQLLNEGHAKSEVAERLATANKEISTADAAKFVTTATKAYCPEHVGDSSKAPSAGSPTPAQKPSQ